MSSADVGNAYVEADLDESEVIFVEIHPDAEIEGYPRDQWVFRLRKSLYGLPQSGRNYQMLFNKIMHKMGFRRNLADDCLWVFYHETEGRIICGNYVDDLVCLTASLKLRDWWRKGLKEAFKKVTFSDTADYLLGVKIEQGIDKNGMRFVELDHTLSITKVAETAQVTNSRRPTAPMDSSVRLHKKREGEDDDSKYKPPYEYASVLGSIMYIANMTRPDLITGVNKLSRYISNPSHAHFKALSRLVAFAYHSRDRRLRYTQVPSDVRHDPFRLHSACDSSFADCPDTKRSTIGRCCWMGSVCQGLISWKSQLPAQVAQNTTEAEVQAAIECAKDILYFRTLLYSLGLPQKGSSRMQVDSTGAISQVNALGGITNQRHYIVKIRKLQEVRHLGLIHTYRVDTNDNVADMFTKPLSPLPYWRLSSRAMGDKHYDHAYSEFRDEALRQERSGGSVKALNAKMKMRMTRSDALRSDAAAPSSKAEEYYQKVMENKVMDNTPSGIAEEHYQQVMEIMPSGKAEERNRKDERKREEMAGKRLQTLANIMAMEIMGRMLDQRTGPADLLRVSDSIDDKSSRAETSPIDHADGPTDTPKIA